MCPFVCERWNCGDWKITTSDLCSLFFALLPLPAIVFFQNEGTRGRDMRFFFLSRYGNRLINYFSFSLMDAVFSNDFKFNVRL